MDALTRLTALLTRIAMLPLASGECWGTSEWRRKAEAWLVRRSWPTRPLRVGLFMPDDEAEALLGAPGACRMEWLRLDAWEDPQSACRGHLFDAVVYHDGEGPVRIVTLERPGLGAGVVEWADLRQDLTFASLFPARVDPAAVVVEGATRARVREGAELLRALIEAAATLSRASARLTLADRMLGRRATDTVERPGGLSVWRSARSHATATMVGLAEASARHAGAWPEAAMIARDAASAYFISCPDIEPADRLDGLSRWACESAVEPVTALRLAAASIGAMEDEKGLAWLVRADSMIRAGAIALAPLDHAAFLESELMHGSDDPMSVGRAAAGICMVCAATPADRIPFVRDDMLEEMAYAGWLVGRDQDRSLLISVFMEIEHAQTAAERVALKTQRKGKRGRANAA